MQSRFNFRGCKKCWAVFEMVPIIMGDQSYENSRALGVALAKLIQATGKPEANAGSGQLRSVALPHLR
jgi:predicted class III extradiol MEMO1 family dioxygenase